MKNFLPKVFLSAVLFLTLAVNSTLAASLSVTKIGSLDLGGKTYTQWWYTSTNPTLYGTAAASSTVTIKIDETEGSATADASGNWQFYSDKLTNGNHQITITSGAETVSFSLNIGQEMPESTASAVTGKGGLPIPMTGGANLLLSIGISGALVLGGAFLLLRKR